MYPGVHQDMREDPELDNSKTFLLFEFCYGTPPSCLKVVGWWVVTYII